MPSSSILLIDDVKTLDAAKAGKRLEESMVVATTARGMAACEALKVPYHRLDSWCSPAEIAELGWRNYRALDEFCAVADKALLAELPDLKSRNLLPMRFSFYFAKIAMDSLSTKILMLSRMLAAEKPRKLIMAERSHGLAPEIIPAFDQHTNLFADILEHLSYGADIEKEWLRLAPAAATNSFGPAPSAPVRSFLNWARRTLKAFGKERDHSKRNFLLFNLGHDIPCILPRLADEGFQPIRPAQAHATPPAQVVYWRGLVADDQLRETYCAAGHDYSELMEKYCLQPIVNRLPGAIAAHDAVADQIRVDKPAFGLAGSINTDLAKRSAMAALQNAGIPLVTYQEGAGYGSIVSPIYDYTEVRNGDLFLAYGEGNWEYYAELGWKTKPFCAVGSAYQDEICDRLNSAPPRSRPFSVMYVGTTVQSNVMHCPNNGLVDTFYFGSQLRIFDEMQKLPPEMRAIAKLHPADRAARELLTSASYHRIKIEERKYEDVLGGADLFIIDFPSTTLLMSCNTRAHIWVLIESGVAGLTEKQEQRLRRRARIFSSSESLAASLARLATGHVDELDHGGTDVMDQSYLCAYGTLICDRGSARRAVAALVRLSLSHTPDRVGAA